MRQGNRTEGDASVPTLHPCRSRPYGYEGASLLVSQNYLFLEPENEECTNYIVLLIRRYRMLL
jgi:hypothetical protein